MSLARQLPIAALLSRFLQLTRIYLLSYQLLEIRQQLIDQPRLLDQLPIDLQPLLLLGQHVPQNHPLAH